MKLIATMAALLSLNVFAAKTIFHCKVESKPYFIQNFYFGNEITANDIEIFTVDKSKDNFAVLHGAKKLGSKTRIDTLQVIVSAGQYAVDLFNHQHKNYMTLSKVDYFNYQGSVTLKNRFHYQVNCKRQPGQGAWFY
jgi:hypothetical protein